LAVHYSDEHHSRAVPSIMAGYARPLAVSAALQMAMPTRAIGDKTFKAGGTSRCSLLFEGAHYEKSLDAMPTATMTTQPAKM